MLADALNVIHSNNIDRSSADGLTVDSVPKDSENASVPAQNENGSAHGMAGEATSAPISNSDKIRPEDLQDTIQMESGVVDVAVGIPEECGAASADVDMAGESPPERNDSGKAAELMEIENAHKKGRGVVVGADAALDGSMESQETVSRESGEGDGGVVKTEQLGPQDVDAKQTNAFETGAVTAGVEQADDKADAPSAEEGSRDKQGKNVLVSGAGACGDSADCKADPDHVWTETREQDGRPEGSGSQTMSKEETVLRTVSVKELVSMLAELDRDGIFQQPVPVEM